MGTVKTSSTSADQYKSRHFNLYHNISKMNQLKIWICDNCPAYFRKDAQLATHMQDVHGKPCTVACDDCGNGLLQLQNACPKSKFHELLCNSLHLKILKDDDSPKLEDLLTQPMISLFKYCCTDCADKFMTEGELAKHSRLHGEFKCNFCNKMESYAPDIALHERACKSRINLDDKNKKLMISCPKCTWVSKCSENDLIEKMLIVHYLEAHLDLEVPLKLTCPVCQKRFFTFQNQQLGKYALLRHLRLQHDMSGKLLSQIRSCKKCPTPVNFRKYRHLHIHNREVHQKVSGKCYYYCDEPECAGLRFPSLKLHISQNHKDDPKQLARCHLLAANVRKDSKRKRSWMSIRINHMEQQKWSRKYFLVKYVEITLRTSTSSNFTN